MRIIRTIFALLAAALPVLGLAAECSSPPQFAADAIQWSGWGNGLANTRQAAAGIASADLDALELRWAFGFPGVGSVVGNPVVHGELLFIGVDTGEVYALAADTACVHWIFRADNGVRTAPALAQVDGDWLLFFGDRNAQVYAVDATSGAQRWKVEVGTHPAAILTGSPQFVHVDGEAVPDRLIVPVSSSEEGIAAVPTYRCCSFRGSVVSLDASNGEQLWKTWTIRPEVRDTGAATQGPSGAAIWSAPTIDLARRQIFVTTGDAYSGPVDIATDAVIGMDLLSGAIQWINQGTADDIWTVACMRPNAPDDCGPDQDYGSPGMLVTADAREFLVAGQKSGNVRAFDLRGGAPLWRTALVDDTTAFGGKIVWGGASDGKRAYFGLGTGGIAGVELADGAVAWFTPLPPTAAMASHAGQDGPLTVSADLVFSGGWDGVVRALSAASGAILWEYDTVRDFTTVNATLANGGSMGAAGPVVAGKRLFVPTGYVGVKNGMKGNALLMFAP